MKVEYTGRGFEIVKFDDLNGVRCSLQESSLATEPAIWLGPQDADPRKLVQDQGWVSVKLDESISLTTRCHLSRAQVIELIDHLQRWVDTGSFVF